MNPPVAHLGEILALSASLIWAFGVTAFTAAGRRSHPFAVSLVRLPLAALLLGLVFMARGGGFWPAELSARQHLWLGLSGALGLALGDTFLFYAATLIGPRRASLMLTTAPIFATVSAWVILGERLGPLAMAGIVVIIAGVLLAASGRDGGGGPFRDLPRATLRRGLLAALVCGLGSGVGNTFAKLGMGDAAPLAATYVRMAWAALVLGVIVAAVPSLRVTVPTLARKRVWTPLLIGVVLGPFVGMWLAISSLKLTDTGVATVLLNILPITVLLPSWLFYRDPPTLRSLAGVVVAVCGGVLLFLR